MADFLSGLILFLYRGDLKRIIRDSLAEQLPSICRLYTPDDCRVGGKVALLTTQAKLATGALIVAVTFFLYRSPVFAVNIVIMSFIGIGSIEGVTDALLHEVHPQRPGPIIGANYFFVLIGALAITIYLIFLQINWRNSMVQASVVVALIALRFS